MIVVASVSAKALATAIVPAARQGFSETPIGPFHTTVLAFLTASANNSRVLGPISSPSLSSGIAFVGTIIVSISASIGFGNPSAATVSIGSNNFFPNSSAFFIMSRQ